MYGNPFGVLKEKHRRTLSTRLLQHRPHKGSRVFGRADGEMRRLVSSPPCKELHDAIRTAAARAETRQLVQNRT